MSVEVKTKSKTVSPARMFLPYQADRIRDTSRFMIDEKARRIGLTFAYAYKYTRKRAVTEGKTWYTANDSSTVLEFIDYCGYFGRLLNNFFDVVDEQVIVDEEEILTKVIRFKDGGRIIGLSSNPTALHGKGGDVIGDEFAYHKQAATMWEAMQATAGWGDDIVLLSTHTSEDSPFNGKVKQARKLYEAAAARGFAPASEEFRKLSLELGILPWSYRRTTIHDAVEQGLVEKINSSKGTKYTREDFLKECRAKCDTEEQWKRQYLCEPSSDASALLPYNLLLTCVADNCLQPASTWQNVYQGVDFGRRNHLSVAANGELVGDVLWTRDLRRMKNMPWRAQLQIIGEACRHPQFRRGCYDQTGLGDMPVEELQTLFGEYRIKGYKFSAPIKHNLAMPLRRRFDDRGIRIPNDQALMDALNKVRQSTTSGGTPKYEANEDADGHADEFWAMALLNDAASLAGVGYTGEVI